jgi:hypothetical protein
MDIALKKDLQAKLDSIIPEYGMTELSYPSFTRCSGYRVQPLRAADGVEAISALLDVGEGIKLEIEVEGARNGLAAVNPGMGSRGRMVTRGILLLSVSKRSALLTRR